MHIIFWVFAGLASCSEPRRRSQRVHATASPPSPPRSRRRARSYSEGDYVAWEEDETTPEEAEERYKRNRASSFEIEAQDLEFAALEEEARAISAAAARQREIEEEAAQVEEARRASELAIVENSKLHIENLEIPSPGNFCTVAVLMPSGVRISRVFKNSDLLQSVVHLVVSQSPVEDLLFPGQFTLAIRGSSDALDTKASCGDLGIHRSLLVVRRN